MNGRITLAWNNQERIKKKFTNRLLLLCFKLGWMNSRFGGGWVDAKKTGIPDGRDGMNRCMQGVNRDACLVSNRYMTSAEG